MSPCIFEVLNENIFYETALSTGGFDLLLQRNVQHIWEKIFLSLDYASFKNCLEVSEWTSQSHDPSHELAHKRLSDKIGLLRRPEKRSSLRHILRESIFPEDLIGSKSS